MGLIAYNPLTVTRAQCEKAWEDAPDLEDASFAVVARAVMTVIHSAVDGHLGIKPGNAVIYVGRSYAASETALYGRWKANQDSLKNYYLRPRAEGGAGLSENSPCWAIAVCRRDAESMAVDLWERGAIRFMRARRRENVFCVAGTDNSDRLPSWDIREEHAVNEGVIYVGIRPTVGRPTGINVYEQSELPDAGRKLFEDFRNDNYGLEHLIGSTQEGARLQEIAQRKVEEMPARYWVEAA